jgi:hypothetical protein
MLLTLAFRHLWVRKLRSLFLLLGFSLGVGMLIVLLSVGEAMLDQSRDVSLLGGGEVTVLPEGIDIEAMRTGGAGGMFFTIDRARFLTRLVLGGPRYRNMVRSVSPAIEGKLLYLCRAVAPCRPTAVRAGGEIPSRARAVGAGLDLRHGNWNDGAEDSQYVAPTLQRLYDEIDRFHLPARPDSTWGEWHYFNLVSGPNEWWYITYLVGGAVPNGRWGGQVLITHRRPAGGYERLRVEVPSQAVKLDTARADLTIGSNTVRQRDGVYLLKARARGASGSIDLDLKIRPLPNRYFPPVELRQDEFVSGYAVPGLAATASGRICVGRRCIQVNNAPAYHDHNWGVWRGVTWDWGMARGNRLSILYGGVHGPETSPSASAVSSPLFLALADSLGVRQVLRFKHIEYQGAKPAEGRLRVSAPERFSLVASRGADTVRLTGVVEHALASDLAISGVPRFFLQMRGRFTLSGRVTGEVISDAGMGFFETYTDSSAEYSSAVGSPSTSGCDHSQTAVRRSPSSSDTISLYPSSWRMRRVSITRSWDKS